MDKQSFGDIKQYYISADSEENKLERLCLTLSVFHAEKILIFCNTIHTTTKVYEYICQQGIQAAMLHADLEKDKQSDTLNSFLSGKTPILIVAETTTWNINTESIYLVINYDLPFNCSYYYARTANRRSKGLVVNLIAPEDVPMWQEIESDYAIQAAPWPDNCECLLP
ncbi:P-loop containing nucleoside triphosphate hydrolase protein [Syncephalis plumigaleata]|nr:P-loop containing nucleoside triphosphate hydrolase protein [Syncephalis plumigaleata]